MRRSLYRTAMLLVAGLVVVAAAAYQWILSAYNAPGPAASDVVLVVPRGLNVQAIAERLAAAGVIERPLVFAVGARLEGKTAALKAGEYQFAPHMSQRAIVALLVEGRTVVRRVTVPEGLTVRVVVELLNATDGLVGTLAHLPEEGSLLPETFHFSYGDARAAMVERMQRAMRETLAELWPKRTTGDALASEREAVILASIIERETPLAAERPRIAGVLINRLRLGMPLQVDPTVIYAVSEGRGTLDRPLTRADLEIESPYNTYRRKGLPIGPIANPGRASLAAALAPAATDELYFVADGSGGHAFARTLAEHQRNVARWRRLRDRASE